MKSRKHVNVTYELTLDKEEADWIRTLVQNPINFDNERDEPNEDVEMRNKLWSALDPTQGGI